MSVRGDLVRSEIVNGQQEFIWEIPAFRQSGAERIAKVNSRIKGVENTTILNVKSVGSARVPGQTVFRVTLEAPR